MKEKLRIVSFLAAIVTLAIGMLVLFGWFIHNDFLRSIVPSDGRMKFNVALSFVFSSIVLLLAYLPEKNKILHFISILLSIMVSLTGFLTLIEYILGCNLGIDELFIKDEIRSTAIYYAGRMSPLSAINFLFIGIGLLLLNKEKAASFQFFYLSGIAFISLMMLISFNFITDIPPFFHFAISTAIGFITLPVAIWFAQPLLLKKFSFERNLFTGFVAAIILIAVISIFSSYYSDKRISTSKLVHRTTNVSGEAAQILSLVKDIESGGRGYIITGDSSYLEYFTIAKNTVLSHVKKLKEFTKDNPVQQVRIDSLSEFVDKRIGFSLQCIQLRNEKGVEAANKLLVSRLDKFYTDKIRYITSKIQQEENDLLTWWQIENVKSVSSFNRIYDVLLASVFLLLAIILFSTLNNINIRKKNEAALLKLNNELEQKVQERAEEIYKNEKRFQALIENNNDIISLLDASFKVFYRSPSAFRITGWANEEIQNSDAQKDIHPDDLEKAGNIMREIMETPGKPVNALFRSLHKDGHYLWLEGMATNLLHDEYVKAIVFNFRDITERVEAEENLKLLEKRILEQSIQEQKKMIRAIINAQEKERNHLGQELHDNINQLLAGTKMYLGAAGNKNETVKPLIKYPLELIDSSMEEIRLLCSRLVTPLKNINLEELAQELLNKMNQTSLIKTNFTYVVSNEFLSDDLKLNIYRILQEQINNILKYAEAKNVTVSIKGEGSDISIMVSDDGNGFDVNSKKSGIGISNMRNRIESFNGKIDIESSPGNGCRIQISIPY